MNEKEMMNIEKKRFIAETRPYMELASYKAETPVYFDEEELTEYLHYSEALLKDFDPDKNYAGFELSLRFKDLGRMPDTPKFALESAQFWDIDSMDIHNVKGSGFLIPMTKDGEDYCISLPIVTSAYGEDEDEDTFAEGLKEKILYIDLTCSVTNPFIMESFHVSGPFFMDGKNNEAVVTKEFAKYQILPAAWEEKTEIDQ